MDGLITDAGVLLNQFLKDLRPWTAEFAAWLKSCESTIEAIFGSSSAALATFKHIYFQAPPWEQFTNDAQKSKAQLSWFNSGLQYAQTVLVGYRYTVEKLAFDMPKRGNPLIFISHGGPTLTHVYLVRDFLTALGLGPIIVRDLPNLNLSINEKVRQYMGICTGAIVLATAEDETTAKENRARPNVENEIGMLQTAQNIGSRIVYLKEPHVKFASNYTEKGWIKFSKSHVQKAFIAILHELRAFGFIG